MEEGNAVRVGVGVMLLKDGKILLGRRLHNLSTQEQVSWSMPGGKLKFGETIERAAKREVFEETEIVLKSAKVISVNNDIEGPVHFVTIGLLSEDFEGDAKLTEPDKFTAWKWFDLKELPSPLFGPTKNLLECYLDGKINKH